MTSIILLPTYNERDNILAIIQAILALPHIGVDMLIIDDNSPDGTANLVEQHQSTSSSGRVHLLKRSRKSGLGPAYLAGFQWALERQYDYIIQMDADFSHSPHDLPSLLASAQAGNELTLGSRYTAGGRTANWAWWRKLISRFGSLYAKFILDIPISDLTGGFKCFHHNLLKKITQLPIYTRGYAFQIEMTYRAALLSASIKEIPITFEERREGQSKMHYRIILEALYQVLHLRFTKRHILRSSSR